jgi:hypothetical protein
MLMIRWTAVCGTFREGITGVELGIIMNLLRIRRLGQALFRLPLNICNAVNHIYCRGH